MTDPNNQQPTFSKNKGSPTIHSAKQSYPYSSKFAANLAPRQKQLEKLICEANSGKGKESRARLPQTRPDQSGARRRMGRRSASIGLSGSSLETSGGDARGFRRFITGTAPCSRWIWTRAVTACGGWARGMRPRGL
jgi:hypothetical protein